MVALDRLKNVALLPKVLCAPKHAHVKNLSKLPILKPIALVLGTTESTASYWRTERSMGSGGEDFH